MKLKIKEFCGSYELTQCPWDRHRWSIQNIKTGLLIGLDIGDLNVEVPHYSSQVLGFSSINEALKKIENL